MEVQINNKIKEIKKSRENKAKKVEKAVKINKSNRKSRLHRQLFLLLLKVVAQQSPCRRRSR